MAQQDKNAETHGNQVHEIWVICLIIGLILINYPFIQIFNSPHLVVGIPGLVLYFFIGWPISILVIYLFIHLSKPKKQSNS